MINFRESCNIDIKKALGIEIMQGLWQFFIILALLLESLLVKTNQIAIILLICIDNSWKCVILRLNI